MTSDDKSIFLISKKFCKNEWEIIQRQHKLRKMIFAHQTVLPNIATIIHVSSHSDLTHYQTTNFRLFQTERVCRRQFQI